MDKIITNNFRLYQDHISGHRIKTIREITGKNATYIALVDSETGLPLADIHLSYTGEERQKFVLYT